MNKATVLVLVSVLLLGSAAFAVGGDEPWDNKSPLGILRTYVSELQQTVQSLQRQIDEIELIPGQQGEPGEQGEQGIQGETGISGTFQTRLAQQTFSAQQPGISGSVTCDEGEFLTGCSGEGTSPHARARPIDNKTCHGGSSSGTADPSAIASITIYAICGKIVPN